MLHQAVQADLTVCACAGVEAGNVGHSAGDSVCSGGVLGSGTQSLNSSLVEKGFKDLAEHIAILCQGIP